MMMNYLKSEWYRITRRPTIYLFTLIVAGITLAANIILFVFANFDSGFPYALVLFSLSNLLAGMPMLFGFAGLLVVLLYADDRKNGTLKNALVEGMPRWKLFTAKSLISVLMGILSMVVILLVYIGSAVLLLEGPVIEPVGLLLGGVVAALPSVIAVVVFAIACFHIFSSSNHAFIFWMAIIFVVPGVLSTLGLYLEPLRLIASWLPTNFFRDALTANMSGFDCLWETPFGLTKCLVAGTGFSVLFFVIGLWHTKRMEF
ncbi:MAG: ABC transporter permease [Coriobacteriales bacterium]|jgi:ABC-2 type transport system permease protein|nr:ABC transporter permease [Coriobacteriales bacterium]